VPSPSATDKVQTLNVISVLGELFSESQINRRLTPLSVFESRGETNLFSLYCFAKVLLRKDHPAAFRRGIGLGMSANPVVVKNEPNNTTVKVFLEGLIPLAQVRLYVVGAARGNRPARLRGLSRELAISIRPRDRANPIAQHTTSRQA
jgi:hypothetical protein